jgi:hypothetical protein
MTQGDGGTVDNTTPSVSKCDETSRRTFLRRVGTVLFSAVIVDAMVEHVTADCGCGGGTTDYSCEAGVSDANCGVPQDHSDADQSCSSSAGWTDGNCYIAGTGQHDEDGNCTAENNHTDAACGDCNDNHDSDEHCAVTGTADSDQMCGHQHFNDTPWPAPIDTDDVCSANYTVPDVGCGIHDNGFMGGAPSNDVDDNCDRSALTPDQNCVYEQPDAHCGTQQYSTQPDESCWYTSPDEACMQEFDSDEHCNSGSDSDEHCFDTSGPAGHDSDEHCGVGGDVDEACSLLDPNNT